METVFKTWKKSRELYLDFFDSHTLNQLNKIPEGFNNNLIWNIGHIIATQHKLVYLGANMQGYLSEELFNKYQSGTKPTEPVSQKEADRLKGLLISQIEPTITDFENGIFVSYNNRTTGIGFHLNSIQDAFGCNNYHEGLHLGYMMSIRKFV